MLRHALGCGSTTNSVLTNLGEDALASFQYVRQVGAPTASAVGAFTPADFRTARARLARHEAPAIRQRSRVRYLPRRLDQLRTAWFKNRPPPELDA